jgi:ferredoxin
VPPGQSILDALDANGVSVLSSCQEGVCGTCETRVIEGIPDHRDSLLSEEEREENEYMMVCVSRSKSGRLVLDL